jgi:hypothetical protein
LANSVLGLLWVGGTVFSIRAASDLLQRMPPESTAYFADTLGNAIVVSSTAALIANLFLRLPGVTRWATWLAALGAVVLVLKAVVDFAQVGTLIFMGPGFAEYHGVLSVLVPALVIWHLFMNYIERNAVVGAALMALATAVIAWETWMLREAASFAGISAGAFAYHWGVAFLTAQVIGYAAFALATLAGANYLLGAHLPASDLPSPWLTRKISQWHLQDYLTTAAGVGVPAFVTAVVFILGWRVEIGSSNESFWAAALLLSSVAAVYAVLLARLLRRRFDARHAAWWTIGGFAAIFAGQLALCAMSW